MSSLPKKCAVPGCENVSTTAPDKRYLSVPSKAATRKAWLNAIRLKREYSHTSRLFVCEDHFNLSEDAENWMKLRFYPNERIRLKPSVVPHIFACQPARRYAQPSKPRHLAAKRARESLLEDILVQSSQLSPSTTAQWLPEPAPSVVSFARTNLRENSERIAEADFSGDTANAPSPQSKYNIEVVQPKMEADVCSNDLLLDHNDYCSGGETLSYHRQLTSGDVAVEENVDDDVDSKPLNSLINLVRYWCGVCCKCFMDENALNDHMYRNCGQINCNGTESKDSVQSEITLEHEDFKVESEDADPISVSQEEHSVDNTVRFWCRVCCKHFSNENSFNDHVPCCTRPDSLHEKDPLMDRTVCHGCRKSFRIESSFKSHLRFCDKVNDKVTRRKCPICFYETKWKSNLRVHIRMKHNLDEKGLDTCTACGETLENSECLQQHMKHCEKVSKAVGKHKCPYCSYETKWKNNLSRHFTIKHDPDEIDQLVCPGCGKSFKFLEQHLRYCEKVNNEVVKHKCTFCVYETKWKNNLRIHIRMKHPSVGNVKYKCAFCVYETKWKNNLRMHLKTKHPIGLNTCYACGETLENSECLQQHIMHCQEVNTKMRHKCPFCHYESKWESNVRRHMRIMHTAIHKKRLVCRGCKKTFKSLPQHLKYCQKVKNEIRKYNCAICLYKTKWKNNLRIHIRVKHPI